MGMVRKTSYDDDTDGDGLSNEQNLPTAQTLDANSKNLAPSDINSSNLSIAELSSRLDYWRVQCHRSGRR